MAGGKFLGWRGDFKGFFLGLRANNNKAWFDAHRRQYEDDVKAPMLALLADLEAEFGPPRRVSRPNRDIRFSADKSPYKLNIYADCEGGGYVALDAEGLVAAGGRYMVDDAQLKRFREAVAAEQSGGALTGIVAGLRKKGYDVEGQELKRVPPPYPQDHPRAELLRHKRLIYWKRWPAEPWIATPKARDRVAQVWRDGADLEAWMRKHMDR
ncbi:MAG: DUF2461 domain-containing protein [Chloroflexi bacterium]|nr:MAG: DUF2461 domain-containing protein [Chloroflexota bacterium]TMF97842.1 MAG: DUF2461 domain-containing protein [Chloroflexota bacterium]